MVSNRRGPHIRISESALSVPNPRLQKVWVTRVVCAIEREPLGLIDSGTGREPGGHASSNYPSHNFSLVSTSCFLHPHLLALVEPS